MTPVKPPRLRPGDLIGLVSPASRIADAGRVERAVRYLEGLGYRVRVAPNALKQNAYLAGTDEERASDIHEMFEDSRVRAIFCIRGGYGSPRILPLLRYRLIARNPKIFVGYSDITVLHLAFWRKAGLVTFHGPMAGVDLADPMDSFTEELFWGLLTSPQRRGPVAFPDPPPVTLVPGRASGRLLGGNLALLCSIIGTGYLPDFSRALLYLEDVGEDPYRVDRMFTHLRGSRLLSAAGGVLLGQFTDCVPRDASSPSFSVEEVLREYAVASGKPTLGAVPFGHERRKMTIPVGIRARLSAHDGVLEYLEGSVR